MSVQNRLVYYVVSAIMVALFAVGFVRPADAGSACHPLFLSGGGIAQVDADTPESPAVEATDPADDVGDVLEKPSPYDNWQLILAFFLPLVIDWITKVTWSSAQKAATMFGVSFVASAFGMYLEHTLTEVSFQPENIIGTFLTVMLATIVFYKGVYKPLGISGAVHSKTG